MDVNKQMQLSHIITKEGVAVAVLGASVPLDSTTAGNVNASIMNRELYTLHKEEVQETVRDFCTKFFAEYDAVENTENSTGEVEESEAETGDTDQA